MTGPYPKPKPDKPKAVPTQQSTSALSKLSALLSPPPPPGLYQAQPLSLSAVLHLPKDAVYHKLTTKVPTVYSNMTLSQVREAMLNQPHDFDSIGYTYVVSRTGKLVGVFLTKEIFNLRTDKSVKEVMVSEIIHARPHTDQEKVIRSALKHGLKAVPIVGEDRTFLGTVPSNQLLAIQTYEHQEDLLRSVGVVPSPAAFENTLEQPVRRSFWNRLPWIVIGLMGGVVAAQVVFLFEGVLQTNVILAAFIPLIVYMGAAVGAQTQTLLIRDLAFNPNLPIIRYAIKQTMITNLIAFICGLIVWGIVMLFWQAAYIGFIVGLATFMTVMSSTLIAIFFPYILFLHKQDPATASGPFATIVQDLTSIIIYFGIAQILL
jgi:magnesium transporter